MSAFTRANQDRPWEEDIRTLDARRHLLEELLEHRRCLFSVARETMEVRGPQAALPVEGGIFRRELGGELAQVCGRGGRSTGSCEVRGLVELRCDPFIRPVGCESQVARALLDVGHRLGERSVGSAPFPYRGPFVADRREERMREAEA
jgi:hypothetical protein